MRTVDENFHEEHKPFAYHLDTEKVKGLKRERRMSDDAIARCSGLTTRIVQMTINNKSCGVKTQQAIADALGVPLDDILLHPTPDHASAA